jgi:hypothetical protein
MGFYDKGLHDAFREYVELVDSFPNIWESQTSLEWLN